MFQALLFGCFFASSTLASTVMPSTTTTKPHLDITKPTKEPSEHVYFRIIYESHSHKMVVVKGTECYVFSLSDAEKVAVHTDAGMRAIEMKLLSAIGTDAVTTTTKDQLHARVAHICGGHAKTFYIETSA